MNMLASMPLKQLFILFIFSALAVRVECNDHKNLTINDLIPSENETGDWNMDEEMEFASGSELYRVINGGAEIYHEYGFRQAIFLSFENQKGNLINLDIFEMENPSSAFGIYSFKTDTSGISVNFGEEGSLSGYYLNFRDSQYLVTVTGLDSSKETKNGVLLLAKMVDRKITQTSERPPLCRCLPLAGLHTNGITYIRGPLGLFNLAELGRTLNLNFIEGIQGIYDSYKILILAYESDEEAQNNAIHALKTWKEVPSYSGFRQRTEYSTFYNDAGTKFALKAYKKYLIILIAGSPINPVNIFSLVQNQIDKL